MNIDQKIEERMSEFDSIGFGNQARLWGVKRIGLKGWIRQTLKDMYEMGGKEALELAKALFTWIGDREHGRMTLVEENRRLNQLKELLAKLSPNKKAK